MRGYVEEKVAEQVRRAYREVSLHRERFRKHGISESAIEHFGLETLAKLPLLEKPLVRSNPAALLTHSAVKHPPASFPTSGTTGTPLKIYWDSPVHQHNMAVREARAYRWAGVSYREPRSMMGMRIVVPKSTSSPPFWRYNQWERQIYFSSYHISRPTVANYVEALNRYKPSTMTGFASANYFLARLISESGMEVHSPKAIITTSDKLHPHMRPVLESVFRTRAYEEYGSVENVTLATECERGRLHVHIDFGYVEILRPDGNPTEPGEVGELVATGLANYNQLFIRYRTGDMASWSSEVCPCGRDCLPVLEQLIGREEDTVILEDGRRVVRLDFLFKNLPGVAEGQIVQEATNQFVINVVPTAAYGPEDVDLIRQRLFTRLDPKLQIDVRDMAEIPREPNGKFRAVISRVRVQQAPVFLADREYSPGQPTML
jgi:phenylacetate-CoA ligase